VNDPLDIDSGGRRLAARRRQQQPRDDGSGSRDRVRMRRGEDRLQRQNNGVIVIIISGGCVIGRTVMMQRSMVMSIARMVRVPLVRGPVSMNDQRRVTLAGRRGVHMSNGRQRQRPETERDKQRNGAEGRHRG
jgi:hypothetical protein